MSLEESVEEAKDEDPAADQSPEDVHRLDDNGQEEGRGDTSCEVQVLAPGDEGFCLLILEDVHLQLNVDGAVGNILETFRYFYDHFCLP